jgi:hypothetical protein
VRLQSDLSLRAADGSITASTSPAGSFVYAPLRVRFNSIATAFFVPFMAVALLGGMIGWALDSLWGLDSLWVFAIPGLPAPFVGLWAMRRGARVRLVVSQEGVLIDNTWRSYRISWSEVGGVGIRAATSPFPLPVLWFRLIGRSPVVAQATPLRCSVRQEFLRTVLSYAPPSVQRLDDLAWLGTDSAISWRWRVRWVRKHPNSLSTRWLDRFGA